MTVRAVVFDWAGTVLDHGSRAPVAALQDVFASAGVPITVAEARLSMGIAKKDHIRSIIGLPRVAAEWERVRGVAPAEGDVEVLYADFLPKQLACLSGFSRVISGVPATMESLRSRGIKVGSTTGYTPDMLRYLEERAREQGFSPDCAVCPQDVPGGGRPAPWMCYLNAIRMEVSPLWRMVKIGDTPSDIEEGLNAGMWTVGVTRTGNEAGLTEEEWNSATAAERRERIAHAETRLKDAGAHYLVESAGDCLHVIDEIAGRISLGERPPGIV
jgi:phosphonoacetaldehyde hydrolase